jgi:hypothetical protein
MMLDCLWRGGRYGAASSFPVSEPNSIQAINYLDSVERYSKQALY